MTLTLTVCCDGTWDAGRMPCRGALPHQPDDVCQSLDVLRLRALDASWSLTAAGDYCPAHARREAHR